LREPSHAWRKLFVPRETATINISLVHFMLR
jgi:hypothetical protein